MITFGKTWKSKYQLPAVVDFPTPPFAEETAITSLMFGILLGRGGGGGGGSSILTPALGTVVK